MFKHPATVIGAALAAAALAVGIVIAAEEPAKKDVPNNVGGGYIAYQNKQGMAIFSHLSHTTAGFQCTDCHTALFPNKRGSFKMTDLFAGKACGKCHDGKTKAPKDETRIADPVALCVSCHMPLKPIDYKPKGFAPVQFNHGTHTADGAKIEGGYACGACHPKPFAPKANSMKMPFPHTTMCGTCHNGKTTSPSGEVAFDNQKCVSCHKPPEEPAKAKKPAPAPAKKSTTPPKKKK